VNSNIYELGSDSINISLNDHGDAISFRSSLLSGKYFDQHTIGIEPQFSWHLGLQEVTNQEGDWQVDSLRPSYNRMFIVGNSAGIWVSIMVEIENNLACWKMRLENDSDHLLDRFSFKFASPYQPEAEEAFTFPYGSGWSLPLSGLAIGEEFSMHYPVKASMQWISLYNQECGIYIGVHDPDPLYKTLRISRRDQKAILHWDFPDLSLEKGETITLPPVYLGAHKNGWRGGADIYQQWANGYLQNPEPPEWYAKNPTWAWVGLREQYKEKFLHILADMQYVSDQVTRGGVQLLQLTGYNQKGHDTQFPDYMPGENFGGVSGLQEQMAIIHRKKRWMSIYVNGRLADPDSSLTTEQRDNWVVRTKPNGEPQHEIYGVVTFDVLCPGASGWRDLFNQRLKYLVETFRVDGIYIDQVSAATSHPCYTHGHDHNKPNQAWMWYKPFIKDLRRNLLEIKPNLFLATEGVNDIFGQYFDSQQAHNDWIPPLKGRGQPLSELYRYTFPDHILLAGTVTDDPDSWFYIKLAHVLGCGIDFGVRDWDVFPEDFLRKSKWIQTWYAKHYKIFQRAEVCSVHTNSTDIVANLFPDKKTILINGAWMPDKGDIRPSRDVLLEIDNPSRIKISRIEFWTLDESANCNWTVYDNSIRVSFPFAEIFGIEIHMPSGEGE
jgi:hypothetical protein